jgi:hypothetical protein
LRQGRHLRLLRLLQLLRLLGLLRLLRLGPLLLAGRRSGRRLARGDGAHIDRTELFAGDRVFVLLAEELLFHQHVDVRRVRAVLAIEQSDRARVLLAAEHEFRLPFPAHFVAPDWKCGR